MKENWPTRRFTKHTCAHTYTYIYELEMPAVQKFGYELNMQKWYEAPAREVANLCQNEYLFLHIFCFNKDTPILYSLHLIWGLNLGTIFKMIFISNSIKERICWGWSAWRQGLIPFLKPQPLAQYLTHAWGLIKKLLLEKWECFM